MIPRCQVVPLPDNSYAFEVDGEVLTQWNAASRYPRPFFFPVHGPKLGRMTRMGHPGAMDHDHHNSIWFAHHKVLGIDFWSIKSTSQVRQLHWHAMRDGMEEAVLAVQLGWFDGHDPAPLLQQELVICVKPLDEPQIELQASSNWTMELQSRFLPTAESLEFQQTNFGFLAVRLAKSISGQFGGGVLTNSAGAIGESQIFEKPAEWVDYSGTVGLRVDPQQAGITYFNHPENPGSPISWHVREDGWMGAGACLKQALITTREQPLMLRYLLHIHSGELNAQSANELLARWSKLPAYQISKSTRKNEQYEVWRST